MHSTYAKNLRGDQINLQINRVILDLSPNAEQFLEVSARLNRSLNVGEAEKQKKSELKSERRKRQAAEQ